MKTSLISKHPVAAKASLFNAGGWGASGYWTNVLGTMTFGMKTVAATLAANGIELLTNGSMEADANWTNANGPTTNERSSEQAHGGTYSRKIVGNVNTGATQNITCINGATYSESGWGYVSSGAGKINSGIGGNHAIGGAGFTVASWVQRSGTATAMASGLTAIYLFSNASPSTCYFDDVSIQRQDALATFNPYGFADYVIRLGIMMPASGVCPFGIVARYSNSLNFWRWEIVPGTAGLDFHLKKVEAGVETTIDSADVDWAAGQAYVLTLSQVGQSSHVATVDGVTKIAYLGAQSFNATAMTFGIYDSKVGNGGFLL